MQLAVFDLDGTITRHDTLFAFVAGYLNRHLRRWPGVLRVLPVLILYALGKCDRGRLKSAFISGALRGCRRAELEQWTQPFLQRLLEGGVFEDARRQICSHRDGGDRLVLLSASPDLYVPQVARALGFDEVICTGVRWDGDRLQGELTTPNRRGAEKARCLEELRRRFPGLPVVAYGNAASDLDHLRLAEHGNLVNGSHRARRRARALGVATVRWR